MWNYLFHYGLIIGFSSTFNYFYGHIRVFIKHIRSKTVIKQYVLEKIVFELTGNSKEKTYGRRVDNTLMWRKFVPDGKEHIEIWIRFCN